MATIREMLRRVTKAKEGIEYEMPKIIEELKKEILDLNRKEQLNLGLNSKGNLIGTYSKATEIITTQQALLGEDVRIKKEGEPFDFWQTGEFLAGFELDFGGGKLEIFSTDSKAEELEERYPHLYGFTKESNEKFNYELIKPHLLEFIKQTIYNG